MYQNNSGVFGRIPAVTLNLIIINALCLLASFVFANKGIDLNRYLGLHYFQASRFNLVQLVTYMFMHAGFSHLLFNMFSLFMFGPVLERLWGGKRFLIYYIVTGVGAGLVQETVWFFEISRLVAQYTQFQISPSSVVDASGFMNLFVTVGASGAVFGILLAFGMLFPNAEMFLMFIPVPIKAKYMVIGYGVIELLMGGVSVYGSGDSIAHFAHLGGMLFGYILIRIWRKKNNSDNGQFYY